MVFFRTEEDDHGEQLSAAELDDFSLRVIYDPRRNALEESVSFPIAVDTVIAGRYQIVDYLGAGVFSRAVQCVELPTGRTVCVKIVRNNKDFLDQSLGEVKLLKLLNENDPHDDKHILRMRDCFYYREHLFIVCELLRDNLYELYRYIAKSGWAPYFTLPRVRCIARQLLTALEYIHGLDILHCDIKPENVLIRSLSRCEVKLIDFGSSSFLRDPHSSYAQSRAYRAPEVVVGLPYGQLIDVWSLGCILAEVLLGATLFNNHSVHSLLANQISLCGHLPERYKMQGRYSHRFFHRGKLYISMGGDESLNTNGDGASGNGANSSKGGSSNDGGSNSVRTGDEVSYAYLIPHVSSLSERLGTADASFLDLMHGLLNTDDEQRLTATEGLHHDWLTAESDPPPRYDPNASVIEPAEDQQRLYEQNLANATPLQQLQARGAGHLSRSSASWGAVSEFSTGMDTPSAGSSPVSQSPPPPLSLLPGPGESLPTATVSTVVADLAQHPHAISHRATAVANGDGEVTSSDSCEHLTERMASLLSQAPEAAVTHEAEEAREGESKSCSSAISAGDGGAGGGSTTTTSSTTESPAMMTTADQARPSAERDATGGNHQLERPPTTTIPKGSNQRPREIQ